MHSLWDWLGPASSVATVIALVVTVLYYLYLPPFNLKKPEDLKAEHDNGRVKLNWKSVHRASSYSIYRDNVKTGIMDIFSCSARHHIDTTVIAGETYQYYIVAEDQGHQSPQSVVIPIEVKGKDRPKKDGEVDGEPHIEGDPESQWAMEALRQLLAELEKKDNKTVLSILHMTASTPDTEVAFSDVCQRAGVTGRQGGAGIASFTVLMKRLGKTKWPFTHHPSLSGQYYKLSKEMAERWRRVEGETKQ